MPSNLKKNAPAFKPAAPKLNRKISNVDALAE